MSTSVKVLPKGQITLPAKVRKKLDIHVGDSLILEETEDGVSLKKGKTISAGSVSRRSWRPC